MTRFEGADAGGLRRALAAGRTHAQRSWSWTIDKLPPHFRIQWRSFLRFVSLGRRQSDVSWAE